jgi:hypothetical protein
MSNAKAKVVKRDYRKYSLTPAQWDAIYDLQKGLCPICLRPLHRPGNKQGKRAASVDHDHRTGRVRGLLDYRCNRFIIGRNTSERAERVYRYLVSEFDGRTL